MKVLHAAETIKGGVATVINSLVDYQTEHNSITKVICIAPSDQIDSLIEKESLNVYQFKRNGRNLLGMISFFITFLRSILKEKPDVVHLHSSFAGLLGRMALILSGRLHKTKVIYCPHAFGFLMETSLLKKFIYLNVEKFFSKVTTKIICVSKTEYNSALNNNFNKKKLQLIYNGVSLKNILNERNLENKNKYKILFVGRFDYQKGIDILASALQKLTELNTNIYYEFNLVGETVNSKEKIKFPQSKKITVNQLGWLKPSELENIYLTHDVILIPSRWEGFAMVPLEAMSYGLPIISSNIDAFKELDADLNNHITLFKDESELVQILVNLAKLPLEQNRKNAIETFIKNFNEDDMKSKTLKCYQ